MSIPSPPQLPLSFPAEPKYLLQEANRAVYAHKTVQDDLAARIKPGDATFENVLLPLMHAENVYLNQFFLLRHPKDVTEDADLRDACREVEKLTNDYNVDSHMRKDIFRLVQAVVDKHEDLEQERKQCLQKIHKRYLHNGLGLEDEQARARFETVSRRIKALCAECRGNFSSERSGLWLSPEDLIGLPSNYLDHLKRGEDENYGKLWMTFKPMHFEPAMKFVKSAEIRKKILIGHENKCANNAPLVKELYTLRDEAARMLGYANNAELKIEDSLAGSPAFVQSFLEDLRNKLTPAGVQIIERQKELKRADMESQNLKSDDKIYLWDTAYYTRILIEQEYSLEETAVSEYFALESMLAGMLKIFGQLFEISFVEITSTLSTAIESGKTQLLHKDTLVYQVWDGTVPGEKFLGYLYLDLHPRDFKLAHSSHLAIHRGHTKADGSYHYPSSILICNWTKPLPNKPSLLRHRETVSLFHELGHAIHNLVSKTEFAIFHGTRVAADFVEAPSKMLENWFWTPDILKNFSVHWAHLSDACAEEWRSEQRNSGLETTNLPSKQMPDKMIENIIRSRYATAAQYHLRQIFLALYDQKVHTPVTSEDIQNMDPQKLYNSLMHEITGVEGPDREYDWGNNHAKFSHLWGKYDATYYSYVLASVIAADMYGSRFSSHPLDSRQGTRYRKIVLEPGGTVPGMDLLRQFLGRDLDTGTWVGRMGYRP